MPTFDRRVFLRTAAAALSAGCAARPARVAPPPFSELRRASELEARVAGRVGVFALDTGSGASVGHRADERFAMCSTFKWLLGAAVLERIDRGQLALERELPYSERELDAYAPVTRAQVARGALRVDELAAAAIEESDNTAANLLLAQVGGPAGFSAFARRLGDPTTRLDRTEPALNTNLPGDPRDTTTPRAMAGDLRAILSGAGLTPASRERLIGWMLACKTGAQRLRAGLPAAWRLAHKTGTGANGAINDLGIAWPPGRAPIVIVVYLSESRAPLGELESVHAELARAIAEALGAR